MKKLIYLVLVLAIALSVSGLAACGGGDDDDKTSGPQATQASKTTPATTTPVKTTPVATTPTATTPTATKTPTSIPTSGTKLSDIYGGKNLGDVQFDVVITSPQMPSQTGTAYWKNFGVANEMKYRMDMSQEGMTTIILVDYGAQTAYMWMKEQNTAYKMDMSKALSNPLEDADQIHPTHIGTDTVDGHSCDVWQWTQDTGAGASTEKVWVWKDKSFPVKMETTDSSGTTTILYQNIKFGTLSDSLFQLPSGVQITSLPGMGGTGGSGGMPTGVPTTIPCSEFQPGSQDWIDCMQQAYGGEN